MKTYEELLAERNALSANVEKLIGVLKNFHPECFEYQQNDFDLGDDVAEVISTNPQQCLAEIKAEAIEAAAEYMMDYLGIASDVTSVSKIALCNYAAKVRQGGV